jgi:hypothetical protein
VVVPGGAGHGRSSRGATPPVTRVALLGLGERLASVSASAATFPLVGG